LEAEEDSEYRGRAQGGAWAEDEDTRSLVSSPRASTSAPDSCAFGPQLQVSGHIGLRRLPLKVQESQKFLPPVRPVTLEFKGHELIYADKLRSRIFPTVVGYFA
jgi:hypothetical protein